MRRNESNVLMKKMKLILMILMWFEPYDIKWKW